MNLNNKDIFLVDRLRPYFLKISKDDILTQSAALAYFAILALAPLIVILLSVLSFLSLNLQELLKQQTLKIIGVEAAQVLEAIINSANNRPDLSLIAGWVAVFLLAVSGSVVFAQLHSVLNIIFKADAAPYKKLKLTDYLISIISRRLYSVLMLFVFVMFSIISLLFTGFFSYILSDVEGLFIDALAMLINISIYALLFSIIYKWIPDRNIHFSKSFLGGIVTALLFVAGKSFAIVYVAKVAMSSAYGAAGSLVALLVWIYYSAFVFFLGAEFLEVFLTYKNK